MSFAKLYRPILMTLLLFTLFLPCSTTYAQDLSINDSLNEPKNPIDSSLGTNDSSQDESQITTDESTSEIPNPPVPPTPPETIDPTDESTTTTKEPRATTSDNQHPTPNPKDQGSNNRPSDPTDKEFNNPNRDESNTTKQSLAPGSLMVIQDNQLPLNYQLSKVITYLREKPRILEVSHRFLLVFFNYPMIPSFFHPLYSLAIPVDHYLIDALRESLFN